jgi:two-component system LytT family response regulator
MIRAILVDDEANCLQSLERTLAKIGKVQVVASCSNISDAKIALKDHPADLLFLDVELQHNTGFELLEEIGSQKLDVIFTTAYEQYALQAIKASALDYLMKPVDIDELRASLNKHLQKKVSVYSQFEVLMQHYNPTNHVQTLALPTMSDIEFVRIDDIIRLHAEGNYTDFFLDKNRKITVSKTLSDYEDILRPRGFIRTHRSHIINLRYIKKYKRGEGGTVILLDGSEVEVSRQKKEEFLLAMNKVQ